MRLLLQPSLMSGTLVTAVTLAAIGSTAWAYVSAQQLFYEYVFGAYGFKTYIWQQSAGLAALRNTVLASPAAYYVLVGLVATAVGFIVYAFLQFLGLLFSWRSWSGLDALGPNRKAIVHELTRRLTLRVVTLIGWAFFGACFSAMLLPFVALLTQNGVEHFQTGMPMGGVLAIIGAVAILALSLHVQVIFLRLVFLRVRLFWGADLAEEAEAKGRPTV
jgi:hypothetical protein